MEAEPKEWLVIGETRILQELVLLLSESEVPSFAVVDLDLHKASLRPAGSLSIRDAGNNSSAEAGRISGEEQNWEELAAPYPFVLYAFTAFTAMDLDSYRQIRDCCSSSGKVLLPVVYLSDYGILGPVTTGSSGDEACLESAWRRLRLNRLRAGTADPIVKGKENMNETAGEEAASPLLKSVVSNAAAHYASLILNSLNNLSEMPDQHSEMSDQQTGMPNRPDRILRNQIYLFDEEALEGKLHPVFQHPLAGKERSAPVWAPLHELQFRQEAEELDNEQLYHLLNRLTSPVTGLLYELEEGAFKQLPLSVCAAVSSDPLSAGSSGKLASVVCAGYDHLEARREAGFTGIEAYLTRLAEAVPSGLDGDMYIGVGTTPSEAVRRAFQRFLQQKLKTKYRHTRPALIPLLFRKLEDDRCQYYLQALKRVTSELELYGSEGVNPLMPVIWVRADGYWYYASDLSPVYALRRVLAEAFLHWQTGFVTGCAGEAAFLTPEAAWDQPVKVMELEITQASFAGEQQEELFAQLSQQANEESQQGKGQPQIEAAEIRLEPALQELAVYGLRFNGGGK